VNPGKSDDLVRARDKPAAKKIGRKRPPTAEASSSSFLIVDWTVGHKGQHRNPAVGVGVLFTVTVTKFPFSDTVIPWHRLK